jgi:hypothetical protein
MVSFLFVSLGGQYKAIKFSINLLVTWGRLKRIFSISALTLASVEALGADFQVLDQ